MKGARDQVARDAQEGERLGIVDGKDSLAHDQH